MLEFIEQLPDNMAGFKATGDVTKEDFTKVVMRKVQELVDRTGKLNYMLVLDTSLRNFTMGSWMEDALMGIKHITKWNRAAIVSDTEAIRKFTDLFSKIMPGE